MLCENNYTSPSLCWVGWNQVKGETSISRSVAWQYVGTGTMSITVTGEGYEAIKVHTESTPTVTS